MISECKIDNTYFQNDFTPLTLSVGSYLPVFCNRIGKQNFLRGVKTAHCLNKSSTM